MIAGAVQQRAAGVVRQAAHYEDVVLVWLERLQRVGVAIMLMMMSLALYNDMARLLGLQ